MFQLWLSRFYLLVTVLFAPALAYAQADAPARSWGAGWGWLWIVLVAALMMAFFSFIRRSRPPFERPRM